MSKGWKIAIGVSLALNLFLIGSLVGVMVIGLRAFGDRDDAQRARRPGIGAAFQALPDDRRQAFREVMRAQALAAGPDFRAAAQARREAMQAMSAPAYDAAAVSAALQRAREADGRARARIDATLAERLSQFSPSERQLFARGMMRGPNGGRGGGRRGGDGRGRPDGPPPPPPPAAEAPR
jgi:uncharacterized membrane protein